MLKKPTRAQRLDAFLAFLFKDQTPETLSFICSEHDLKVTPYTRGLMATLVADGFVSAELDETEYPPRYLYSLTDDGRHVARQIVRRFDETR